MSFPQQPDPPAENERWDPVLLHCQKILTNDIARECAVHLVRYLAELAATEDATLTLDSDGPAAGEDWQVSGAIPEVGFYVDLPLKRLETTFLFTDFTHAPSMGQEAIVRGFLQPALQAMVERMREGITQQRREAGYQLVLASRPPLAVPVAREQGAHTHAVVARYQGLTLQATTFYQTDATALRCSIELLYAVAALTPELAESD